MKRTLPIFMLIVSGCAGLSETALPRAAHTLEGLKSFYLAVCEAPPAGKEQLCEDGAKYIDEAGAFYNEVNSALGDDQ